MTSDEPRSAGFPRLLRTHSSSLRVVPDTPMAEHDIHENAMNDFTPNDAAGYLYEQMADHLTARIESGELTPNTSLSSEHQLASEYGVSLGTARHATRLLRFRGLVVTVRSKGTYIANHAASFHCL